MTQFEDVLFLVAFGLLFIAMSLYTMIIGFAMKDELDINDYHPHLGFLAHIMLMFSSMSMAYVTIRTALSGPLALILFGWMVILVLLREIIIRWNTSSTR
jgi:hypothetical protein